MPRILLTISALLTAVVVAAGCGNSGASSSEAASVAPSGSLIYGEATLDPDDDQQAAIDALIEKFPGEGSAGERIRKLMEDAFSESDVGLSFSDDVEPWLGDQAAFFVSSLGSGDDASGAVLVATDDEGKSRDAIEKAAKGNGKAASYKDHDYYSFSDDGVAGVLDGWVVLGNLRGFKAAVDTADGGKPIEDDESYTHALADAPKERLGFVYFNTPAFVDELSDSGGTAALGQFADLFKDPILATLNVTEQGVRLEATLPESISSAFPLFGQGGDAAAQLPADSWLALAQPDLGKTIDQLVTLFGQSAGGRDALAKQLKTATGLDLDKDVIAWMGDWSLFVRGTSVADLNGALTIETKDPAASRRFIAAVARLARKSAGPDESVGPLELGGGGEGITVHATALPEPIHLFQRDDKVVAAYGDAAAADALAPSDKLGDTAEFKEAEQALGGDYDLGLYVAVAPILSLVDSTGAGDDEGWLKVKPYLEPLGAIVAGARKDGDKLRSALGVSVR
jgi:hypothetical protein